MTNIVTALVNFELDSNDLTLSNVDRKGIVKFNATKTQLMSGEFFE